MALNLTKKQICGRPASDYDWVYLLDGSGSMDGKDCPGGKSRWNYSKETGQVLAAAAILIDTDGMSIGVFSSGGQAKNLMLYPNTTPDKVEKVFASGLPGGTTPTAEAVGEVIEDYLSRKYGKKGNFFGIGAVKADPKAKPICVIIDTDGVPNDKAALVRVIVDATKRIKDKSEIHLCFKQSGSDSSAKAFLSKLDNDLEKEGAVFDIVTCTTCDEIAGLDHDAVLERVLRD